MKILSIQSLLEPEKRHAAEEQTAVRTERDGQAEPPDALSGENAASRRATQTADPSGSD